MITDPVVGQRAAYLRGGGWSVLVAPRGRAQRRRVRTGPRVAYGIVIIITINHYDHYYHHRHDYQAIIVISWA